MKYNKKKLFEQAKKIAKEKKCFFVEQLVSFLPCSKFTYYEYFKIGSNESNAIKDILDANRVEVKTAMFNKWFKSDNPTLQVALMKLIASDDEAHRLNGTRTENKNTNTNTNLTIVTDEETKKNLEDLIDETSNN